MFHVSITAKALIEGRLNAEAYSPEILNDLAIMRSSGVELSRLGEMVRAPINNSIRNVTEVLDAPGAEIPMYRPADISDGWCDYETAPSIPREFETLHSKSRVFPGDIVLGIAGSIAIAGRVTNSHAFGNINGSSARIAPTPRSEGYLLSYLNSRFGRSALLQWAVGAVQRHLNLEDLPDVCVARPCVEAQQFIDSKVLQAEMLMTGARKILSVVGEYHDSLLPPLASDANWRPFKLSSQELYDLLTSEAYPPDVAEYFRHNSSIPLGKACEVIYTGTTRPNVEPAHGGVEQATSRSCSGQFIRRPCNHVVPPRSREKYLRRGDIIVTNAAHDKSYIGKDYTLYHDDRPNFPSTKVLVLRPSREHFPASYLHRVLKSPLGYRQTQAVIRGISAGIAPDDMERIRIPLPILASNDRDRWFAMDEDVYQAGFALEVASCLTSSARFLVEALIEGKVTEAELIAAGNDADADRVLLARLRDDGLDGAGTRLFPDIDALFDLIAQVQGTGAESCVDP